MMYAVAIERGDNDHAFGVAVPDIPGCFSAGDTFEEAIANACEAIELQIEAALDQGRDVPLPSDHDKFVNDPQWRGWMWASVEITANGGGAAAHLKSQR